MWLESQAYKYPKDWVGDGVGCLRCRDRFDAPTSVPGHTPRTQCVGRFGLVRAAFVLRRGRLGSVEVCH